jgi:hypothetical protein
VFDGERVRLKLPLQAIFSIEVEQAFHQAWHRLAKVRDEIFEVRRVLKVSS